MSAICGIVELTGAPVERSAAERLLAALDPYGPDGRRLWVDGCIALGHQQLTDTPEAAGDTQPCSTRPPLVTPNGLMITSDARLDNRAELCDRLSIAPTDRAHLPDSMIILAAYARWAAGCVPALLGDFAFAIWDSRARRLFCARDALGITPFHYRVSAGRLTFATHLPALVATGPNAVNWSTVKSSLLRVAHYDAVATFFQDISKLPPGHCLEADAHGIRVTRYFAPEQVSPLHYADDRDYAERLRELLHDAVHCRLRTNGRLAIHVSGGLDSAAIAVIAARAERRRGRIPLAYSYSPPPSGGASPPPEWAHIAAVCAQEHLTCEYTEMSPHEALAYLERDVAHVPALASAPWDLQIFRRASASGARVLLSGWGGDELISGHGLGYYADLLGRGRIDTLWLAAGHRLALDRPTPVSAPARAAFLLRRAVLPWLPLPVAATLVPEFVDDVAYAPFISRELIAHLRTVPTAPMRLRRWEEPGVRKHQLELIAFGHLQRRTETWAAETANLGLVVRYPLLDRRVVEFALGAPPRLFIQQGWIRGLFRSAVLPLLPAAVSWQKKEMEASLESARSAVFAAMVHRMDACLRDHPAAGQRVIDRAALAALPLDPSAAPGRRMARRVLNGLQCEAILRLPQ